MKFEDRPFLAIWETTQACDLVCKHCRACAQPRRHPEELTTGEGKRLLDRLERANVPLVVLTGGDPAKRPDLVELVAYGTSIGLNMALTPSATPLVTENLIHELAMCGLRRLAVSIDGPDALTHDAFRGVAGSFDESLRILRAAKKEGISTQINTTVHAGSIDRLGQVAALAAELEISLWSVFFVVPTGRAEAGMLPSPERVEQIMTELAEIAESSRFGVKTTAAPHYRRVLLARKRAKGHAPKQGVHGGQGLRVNDGRGFLFVSHRGDIFPSGFLPVSCGNVRKDDPIQIYRSHPTFLALRDASALTGKCGACEYRVVCGGSRARAYAMTGSMLDSDALCSYVPPSYVPGEREKPAARPVALPLVT